MQRGKSEGETAPVAHRTGPFKRFLQLSPSDRRLLIKAALTVAAFRIGLRLLPFHILQQLSSSDTRAIRSVEAPSVERISWAVSAMGRRIPLASCLTQALAARYLLSRRGISCQLCIGVIKSLDGKFQAHAWVDVAGRTVIGGPATERYARLLALGEAR